MPKNINKRLYISTIDPKAETVAKKYGLGLEIADFCLAANMDTDFEPHGRAGLEKMHLGLPVTFHFPFAELSPCAIDPLVRQVVLKRHRQALKLAMDNGAKRFIVHSGYIPLVYFGQWFISESVKYWKSFLAETQDDFTIYLENVMEAEYSLTLEVVKAVDDSRFRLCLDVGHVNCVSKQPVLQWIENMAPYIGHVHIHNNDGEFDHHRPIGQGSAPMEEIMEKLLELPQECSFAVECMESESSVKWLIDRGYLR